MTTSPTWQQKGNECGSKLGLPTQLVSANGENARRVKQCKEKYETLKRKDSHMGDTRGGRVTKKEENDKQLDARLSKYVKERSSALVSHSKFVKK